MRGSSNAFVFDWCEAEDDWADSVVIVSMSDEDGEERMGVATTFRMVRGRRNSAIKSMAALAAEDVVTFIFFHLPGVSFEMRRPRSYVGSWVDVDMMCGGRLKLFQSSQYNMCVCVRCWIFWGGGSSFYNPKTNYNSRSFRRDSFFGVVAASG